jgi:hypothetical protein
LKKARRTHVVPSHHSRWYPTAAAVQCRNLTKLTAWVEARLLKEVARAARRRSAKQSKSRNAKKKD